MSDTPRTDAVALHIHYLDFEVVQADFARQLERELAEAKAELVRHQEFHGAICLPNDVPESYDSVRAERDALQRRVQELEANAHSPGPCPKCSGAMQMTPVCLQCGSIPIADHDIQQMRAELAAARAEADTLRAYLSEALAARAAIDAARATP